MEPEARKRQIMIWYTIAAVVGVFLIQHFWSGYTQVETIPYSEFERLLNEGKVAEVTVAADSVQGSLREPLPSGKRVFYAVRVDPQFADKLAARDVVVKGAPSGGLAQIVLSWVLPAVIFYLVWIMIFRRMAERQGFVLRKSRRRDPRALDFGTFLLTEGRRNRPVTGPLTLAEVEAWLTGGEAEG